MKQKSISISTYIIKCAPTHTPQHTHTLLHTQSYLKKYLAQGHAGKPYMIWSQAYG